MTRLPTTRDYTSSRRSPEEGLDDVLAEIASFVGMSAIKEDLYQLIALGRLKAIRRDREIPIESFGLHLVFTGPPGTGKTVMARLIGRLFKAIGLLNKGHCVEVDRSKLVGSHLGEAGQLVADAFRSARDGVLFIDEAYALASVGGGVSGGDHYGNDAINTLLKLMEDYRDQVVVIAAGYTDGMRRFLDNNVGLKSRFTRTFEFQPYSHDELAQIFQLMVGKGGYILQEEARREAEKYIKTFDTKREEFGNAREVRNFVEKIIPAQAMRFYAEGRDLTSLTNEELLTIAADDIRNATGW